MAYTQPEVISIVMSSDGRLANCDVRFVNPAAPTPGHGMINVTAFIPTSPNDQQDVIRARAITVAKQALQNAVKLP